MNITHPTRLYLGLLSLLIFINSCTLSTPTPTLAPTLKSSPTNQPPTSTPLPPTSTPSITQEELWDLLQQGKIEVEALGGGITQVNLRVRRLVDQKLIVTIPIGTYFISNFGNIQNMVVTRKWEISLRDDDWQQFSIDAACANISLAVPRNIHQFNIQQSSEVEGLEIVLGSIEDGENLGFSVIQAIVWILSDNATFEDLGTLIFDRGIRAIDPTDAAMAMQIIDRAGIDISLKNIWHDRHYLKEVIEDENLLSWISQKENSLPHPLKVFENDAGIKESALSPDGKTIAISDQNGTVKIIDTQTIEETIILVGLIKVTKLAFSPDGKILAIANHDQPVLLWDINSQLIVKEIGQAIINLAFSPDGRVLATIASGSITLWDWESGLEIDTFGDILGSRIRFFEFSPDGNSLVMKIEDRIEIWSILNKRLTDQIIVNEDIHLPSLAISPDGTYLAYAEEYSINLLNLITRETIEFQRDIPNTVINIAFSHDGTKLSAVIIGYFLVWNVDTQEMIHTNYIDQGIIFAESDPHLTFTPDGQFLVIVTEKQVGFWDVTSSN